MMPYSHELGKPLSRRDVGEHDLYRAAWEDRTLAGDGGARRRLHRHLGGLPLRQFSMGGCRNRRLFDRRRISRLASFHLGEE